jgi:hypothetical protein
MREEARSRASVDRIELRDALDKSLVSELERQLASIGNRVVSP